MTPRVAAIAAACLTAAVLPTTAHALSCGEWKDAERSIRTWWAKAYPQERLLSIEKNGPAQTYSKVQSTHQKKLDEYGNEWEYFKKNPYCAIPAKVKAQQPSGPRVFSVSAVFKVTGRSFSFDDVAVGGSEAQLEAGQATAPGKEEIVRLLVEKVVSRIPPELREAIRVQKAELTSKVELRRYEGGKSAYSFERAEVVLAVDGEARPKCETSLVDLYKGEEANMRLDAGGPWKLKLSRENFPATCVPSKYYDKVYAFSNNLVAAAPPAVDTAWMKKVAGTFKGDLQGDVYNPATTVLSADGDGRLSGTYDYTEKGKHLTGTISDCTAPRVGWARCKMQDQENKGELQFQFQKDWGSFTGKWWTVKEHLSNSWSGSRDAP